MPAFTPPRQVIESGASGPITAIRYRYPAEADVLVRDVKPLLEAAGVDLVLNGHSHLWNRFESPSGTHYLESSNVGNSYGCFLAGGTEARRVPAGAGYPEADYPRRGDPAGLVPAMPSVFAPQRSADGRDLPCVASNDHSVFSVLDTESGTVRSYIFEAGDSASPVRLFDSFPIGRKAAFRRKPADPD